MFEVPATVSAVPAIRGLCGSLLGLSTISVGGRFWARSLQDTSFQADDWLMIPAWATFVALCACLLEGTYLHTLGYTPEQAAPYHPSDYDGAKVELPIGILLSLCLGFVKLSALLFYKRVFCIPNVASTYRNALNASIVLVSVWIVAFIVFFLASCGTHLDGYWIRPIFDKYCQAAHRYLISSCVTDVFLELLVVILPVIKIWNLRISMERKLATTLVFLTALLSLGASIARLAIVAHIAFETITSASIAALANSAIFFMVTLEAGSGLIAINMPTLWYFKSRKAPEKVFRRLRSIISHRSLRSSISGSSGRGMDGSTDMAEANAQGRRNDVLDRVEAGWAGPRVLVDINGTNSAAEEQMPSYDGVVVPKNDIRVTSRVSQHFESA